MEVSVVWWLLSFEIDTVTRVQILDEFHKMLIPFGKVSIHILSPPFMSK